MKLKTRITFLFVFILGFYLLATVISSINQSILLEAQEGLITYMEALANQKPSEARELLLLDVLANSKENFVRLNNNTSIQIATNIVLMLVAFIYGLSMINRYANKRLSRVIHFNKIHRSHNGQDARLVLSGNDELNMLASIMNDALDDKDAESMKYEGRLRQERKLILALISNFSSPAAFFRLNGVFVGSNLDEEYEKVVTSTIQENISTVTKCKGEGGELDHPSGKKIKYKVIGPSKGVRMLVKAEIC